MGIILPFFSPTKHTNTDYLRFKSRQIKPRVGAFLLASFALMTTLLLSYFRSVHMSIKHNQGQLYVLVDALV
jgi:hypothetical protein